MTLRLDLQVRSVVTEKFSFVCSTSRPGWPEPPSWAGADFSLLDMCHFVDLVSGVVPLKIIATEA